MRVALQHRTTRASAIRPFLLLKAGDTCTEFERAESERLLRAQPYLADATVAVIPDDSGGVRLHVSTVDEIPLVIGGGATGGRLSSVTYGSANVLGEGLHAEAEWHEGFAYRDGLGVRFINHHAFDTPHRFLLSLERMPHDTRVGLVIERPLLTSAQRTAWHASVSDGSEFATFVRQDRPDAAMAFDRSRADLGGIFRVGGEQRRVFAGPFISHQRVDPAARAVVITDTGFVFEADPELEGRFAMVQRTRVAAAVGARLLSFTRVHGVDALSGAQDVATGVQVAALAGRSVLTSSGGTVFGLDVYGGGGVGRHFVSFRAQWEGERADRGGWADAVASGRVVWHNGIAARRMVTISGEFAGAWGARLPYQIPLGRQAGVRGYHDSRAVGARRALARVEHRWVLGHLTPYVLLGAAGFADAGAVWAGGVPYGRNSGLRAGAGVGLLAAVPPRSRQTLRLDLALPLVSDRHASYELRATTSVPIRMFWRDPTSLSSVRTITPPSGLFGLP